MYSVLLKCPYQYYLLKWLNVCGLQPVFMYSNVSEFVVLLFFCFSREILLLVTNFQADMDKKEYVGKESLVVILVTKPSELYIDSLIAFLYTFG
jgi:hypothetical protein